ncbi:PHP domain-containing protein [Candidatus Woesearchaeota archaeon]|jgi:hypothetical protein|nr:PHP domain-containing protein [Candidatus Woesearchaeota archaeon]MBT3304817.1 PHP domain-containing protein [Candidatus Woesearchaeota archaeon]MBT4367847.1 PHP domain-containing protein [Candidatus Woesearchaeota archaeon]MBT4712335.1 PHP domain-containing protein [Candidatus Woesearchaeota archaeon]MBT6639247.1 PHP domain-containing protein [Candidatus Woesearchaeota archaeon]
MLGNYHVHTTMSDGSFTPDEIVQKAISLGLDEIGIADHYFTTKDGIGFVDDSDLPEYIAVIQSLNERYAGTIRVLAGLEIDSSCYNVKRSRLPFHLLNRLDYVVFEYVENRMLGQQIRTECGLEVVETLTEFRDPYMAVGVYTLRDIIELKRKLTCSVGLVHPNLNRDFVHYEPQELARSLQQNDIFIDAYVKTEKTGDPAQDINWPLIGFFKDLGPFGDSFRDQRVEIAPGTDTHSTDNIAVAINAINLLVEQGFQLKTF